VTGANTYTIQIATNNGTITTGTATLVGVSNSGKAVVLWGNYIARVSNFTAGAWAPGSPVTAQNGKFVLAAGQGNADGTYTVTATNTIDPEVGYVLRVQGATTTETAHIVIVAF
jgi:DMSO/TMAO reductase YedYZ molybdopterin-dependent catalytic subunit